MSKVIASRYALVDSLGKGGFGAVFRAIDLQNGGTVAIKVISLKNVPKDEIASIQSEISLLKELKHIHITKYIDHHTTKDELMIIMEFIENGSLQGLVKKCGKLPEQLAGIYVAQVLEGLAFLHEEGVIHRDIKGANILTDKMGVIKLADFGVASKLADVEEEAVVGTPYWMAPEIIELNPPQYASDIWSLGATVIELLTTQPPYFNLDPMPALFRIVQDEHPPLPPNISPACKDFLLECFQKDPNRRASAVALLNHAWIRQHRRADIRERVVDMDLKMVQEHNQMEQGKRAEYRDKFKRDVTAAPAAALPPVQQTPTPLMEGGTPHKEEGRRDLSRYAEETDSPMGEMDLDEVDGDMVTVRFASVAARSSPKRGFVPMEQDGDDFEDDFELGEDDDDLTLSQPKGQPSAMRTFGLDAVGQPMFVDGGSTLARFTEFGEDDEFDEELRDEDEDEEMDFESILRRKQHSKADDVNEETWDVPVTPGGASGRGGLKDDGEEEDGDDADIKEDEDPFAQMDKEMEGTVADGLFSDGIQAEHVVSLIKSMQPDSPDETILESCGILLKSFEEHPEFRHELVTHHGIVPILEILDHCKSDDVAVAVIRVLNLIISGDVQFKEMLCLMGALPIVFRFLQIPSPEKMGLFYHVSCFIREMCMTSTLTLQMFIGCRGLPVLSRMMSVAKVNYENGKNVLLMAIDCTMQVFHVQGGTPKSEFTRVFVRSGLAKHISYALRMLVNDSSFPSRETYIDKITTILLIFSQADHAVVTAMAILEVLMNISAVFAQLPETSIVKMTKFIKNLSMSMDAETMDQLQRCGFVSKLVAFYEPENSGSHITEIRNQALISLYYLCRLHKGRRELAVVSGVVPHLISMINENSPLKEFASPIVLDLPMTGSKACFAIMWKESVCDLYISLLRDPIWQSNAMDSIAFWMSTKGESQRLNGTLIKPENFKAILRALSTRVHPFHPHSCSPMCYHMSLLLF
eukprot:TRINITY_DN444_c0_g2_i1.p1 TRINITY_DN444_c0_g2~~TRINITY_DN444_c0_g2_i1.p1  ORF type:complete len:979 (+),score=280.63 TRINITY_DN444_c0_g2_i1:125-3061(+)